MVLKSKPQDIEFNVSHTGFAIALYFISGVWILSQSTEMDIALYSIALDVAILYLFCSACLNLLQLKPRTMQTLTALFGTGIIYHVLAWPLIEQLTMSDISDSNKANLSLVFLMLLSWQVLVNAHIFKNAFSIAMTKAVILSVSYWLMSMTLSQILIPAV